MIYKVIISSTWGNRRNMKNVTERDQKCDRKKPFRKNTVVTGKDTFGHVFMMNNTLMILNIKISVMEVTAFLNTPSICFYGGVFWHFGNGTPKNL